MDYQKLLKAHRDNKAHITVAASIARKLHDPGFGFLDVNSENQVVEFRLKLEGKPANVVSVSSSSIFLCLFMAFLVFPEETLI